MFYIGCHLSASAGFYAMGKQALEIGANTFQFFTRNPRGGQAKEIDPEDVKAFLDLVKENNFGKIVAHAPYTLNPASAKPETREFAFNTFKDDLKRMEFIPGNYYNFHPGSHVGQGTDIGIKYICDMLNENIEENTTTTVLLETMSGKGSEIGAKFEELKLIIDNTDRPEKIGICLDTCHINDGGYDVVNNFENILDTFDKIVGLNKLYAIHLNDSKNPFESHKDRHEKIGQGHLGLDAISKIINNPTLQNIPFILETPNEIDGYKEEIELLKSLKRTSD